MNLKIYTLNTAHQEQRKNRKGVANMTDKQYKSQKAIAETLNLVLMAILNDNELIDITKNALIISELLKADEITKAFEIVAHRKSNARSVTHYEKMKKRGKFPR